MRLMLASFALVAFVPTMYVSYTKFVPKGCKTTQAWNPCSPRFRRDGFAALLGRRSYWPNTGCG